MGTIFQVTVVGAPSAKHEAAIGRAFAEIDRLEGILSEWLPTSEISLINKESGVKPVRIGSDTSAVVAAGLDSSRWSDGAFDLSWAAMRGLYLFQPGEHNVPSDAEIKKRVALIGYKDVVFDRAQSTVFLRRKGMAIGTGGIAKGYALDRAGEILKRAGIDNFTIFGGGQVQVAGRRGPRPWRVGIQHPRRQDYIAYLEATDGSIATSGDYEHGFVDDHGRRWHHIIDPKTGYPVEHTTSVTVIAKSGLYADAIDNGIFVLGPEKGLEMLSRIPVHVEAVVITKDFRVLVTPGLRHKLIYKSPLVNGRLPDAPDSGF